MKKAIFWIFIAAMAAAAQTKTIPAPSGVNWYVYQGYTDTTYSVLANIGDFDGDGSDDIVVQFGNGGRIINCIYSIKKQAYLVVDTSNHFGGSTVISGKLASLSTQFVVIGSRYYVWTGSPILSKKKAP